jgi:hypothetical protein
MQSWENGFSVTVTRKPKSDAFHVRYRCPWCEEISNVNVAATHAVGLPQGRAALLAVCQANHCRRPSMVTVAIHDYDSLTGGMIEEVNILPEDIHPNPRESYAPDGVPEDIAADFEEALNCRAAGFKLGSATVGRRTLQAALLDKGATQHDLVHQINELPDDVLPRQLKLAAQHVRLIGNDAAHVRAVTADDVTSLVNFVHLVLQQLYILPHEIAKQTRTIQPQHMPGAPTAGRRRGRGNGHTAPERDPAAGGGSGAT